MPAWKPWLISCVGILALLPPETAQAETALAALHWQRPMFGSLERDLECLALNVYWEARSESLLGQVAVAAVTLNRVAAPGFPDSVCEVVFQGEERGRHLCQFSWRCDGRTDQPRNLVAWEEARRVARLALSRQVADPTDGALWYHAVHVRPEWTGDMAMHARIGHHLFYGQRVHAVLPARRGGHIAPPARKPRLAATRREAFQPLTGELRIDFEGSSTEGLMLCADQTLCARGGPPAQIVGDLGGALPLPGDQRSLGSRPASDIPAAAADLLGLARVDRAIGHGPVDAAGWGARGATLTRYLPAAEPADVSSRPAPEWMERAIAGLHPFVPDGKPSLAPSSVPLDLPLATDRRGEGVSRVALTGPPGVEPPGGRTLPVDVAPLSLGRFGKTGRPASLRPAIAG